MNKLILSLLVLLICMQYMNAFKYDDLFDDKGGDEDQLDSQEVDNEEASQFLKRLFHPFKTKNEEIKRETREVYEEKCESVVPGQRFCPSLTLWKDFKDYENGSK